MFLHQSWDGHSPNLWLFYWGTIIRIIMFSKIYIMGIEGCSHFTLFPKKPHLYIYIYILRFIILCVVNLTQVTDRLRLGQCYPRGSVPTEQTGRSCWPLNQSVLRPSDLPMDLETSMCPAGHKPSQVANGMVAHHGLRTHHVASTNWLRTKTFWKW